MLLVNVVNVYYIVCCTCKTTFLANVNGPELTFTFAMLSPVRLSSVASLSVCQSVVCNVRSPYSGGSNFRQYFYGIRYLGHPLTSTENFTGTEGNPFSGGAKHKRGSQV